jgi:hypothetical protein
MGAAHIGIGEGLAKCPLQEACKRELAHKLCSRACSRRPVGGRPPADPEGQVGGLGGIPDQA